MSPARQRLGRPRLGGVDLATVRTLFASELRSVLRDRRTLLVAVVLPMLVIPLFFFLSQKAEEGREVRMEETVYRYALAGEAAEVARQLIQAAEAHAEAEEQGRLLLEEVVAADPEAALAAEELHLWVEAVAAESIEDVSDEGEGETGEARAADEGAMVPVFRLTFRSNWEGSSTASRAMGRRLREGREVLRARGMAALGFPIEPRDLAVLESRDVASAEALTGATLGRFATVFAMLFLLTGGSVVAADTLAGEKERGTLETLLTTGAGRREIVYAKQLLIIAVGVAIAAVQLVELFVLARLDLFALPAGLSVALSPATALLLLLLLLPLAAMVASGLLWLSGRAQSYKEFQIYFFPVFLVGLLPSLAAMLPGLPLRSAVALVPIANTSVAVREVLMDRLDLPMLALVLGVNLLVAWWGVRQTTKTLSTERLITAARVDRAEALGGPELFTRHAGRWFAAMWVLIFLASANGFFPSLQGQLLFNLVGVFLGGSLFLIWRYRLPWRETLSLRPVRPAVLLAVLLGAPASFLAALAVGKVSFWLFPMPEGLLEDFGKSLMPESLPLWQILFLITVLPAICEEVAFRGVLLSALRRRLRPLPLCLVVGLTFGIFHFQLIRILPTAVLGVVTCALTLWSGSILPAMLWHALNNGVAIFSSRAGLEPFSLSPWAYAGGLAISLLSFWILWRCRESVPYQEGEAPP